MAKMINFETNICW